MTLLKGLSDLQLGDEKVTLNHLDHNFLNQKNDQASDEGRQQMELEACNGL